MITMRNITALFALPLLLAACHGGSSNTDWTIEDLTPDQGLSIRIPQYSVPEGDESQRCYFFHMPDLNNGQSYYVDRFELAITDGSHHLNIFRVKTIVNLKPEDGTPVALDATHGMSIDATVIDGMGNYKTSECWKSANWADWPLVANNQDARMNDNVYNWKLPTNVATRFDPGEMIMIQPHYVNATRQPTPKTAHIGINMFLHKGTDQLIEMGSLFATQQSIRICESNPTPTFSGTCRFPADQEIHITAANGHFHSRGRQFTMFSWDGKSIDNPPDSAKFYESDTWNDPPMINGLDVQPPSGGGMWWNCAYQWQAPSEFSCDDVNAKDPQKQNDCCYTFGGNTDVGEHCNVFLYYYPRVDNKDVFCN
jgi:hypothetical protein